MANGASSSNIKVIIYVGHFFRPTDVHLRGHWLPVPDLCRSHSQAIPSPRVNLVPSASTCGRPQEQLCWICCFHHSPVNLGILFRLRSLLSPPALIPSSQRALKSPIAFFKGGDISQLGGDFVLGPGELFLVSVLLHDASTLWQGTTVPLRRECAGPPIVRPSSYYISLVFYK